MGGHFSLTNKKKSSPPFPKGFSLSSKSFQCRRKELFFLPAAAAVIIISSFFQAHNAQPNPFLSFVVGENDVTKFPQFPTCHWNILAQKRKRERPPPFHPLFLLAWGRQHQDQPTILAWGSGTNGFCAAIEMGFPAPATFSGTAKQEYYSCVEAFFIILCPMVISLAGRNKKPSYVPPDETHENVLADAWRNAGKILSCARGKVG